MKPPLSMEELVSRLLDGQLAGDEREQLIARLRDDAAARADYFETVALHAALRQEIGTITRDELPTAAPTRAAWRTSIRKFFLQPTPLSLAVSAGVMFVLLSTLAVLAPPVYRALSGDADDSRPAEVAEAAAQFTGEFDAVWDERQATPRLGTQLSAGRRVSLRRGLAQFKFRGGAVVLVEGPADLEFTSPSAAALHGGKLIARTAGERFTVTTTRGAIVDLGTEFGVAVDKSRNMSVHVLEGLVEVHRPNQVLRLTAGESLVVTEAGVQREGNAVNSFVRSLPPSLDVGDIVAGGDGKGNRRSAGIDLLTGRRTETLASGGISRPADYLPCDDHPLIDGVFIVAAGNVPQQLDSAGHKSEQLGSHESAAWNSIWTQVDGSVYQHANSGFTFDLQKIRELHGAAAAQFESLVHCNSDHPGSLQLSILVDGAPAFTQTIPHGKQVVVRVPLPSDARYLTLALTDAGDGLSNDGVLLRRPRLRLFPTPTSITKPPARDPSDAR